MDAVPVVDLAPMFGDDARAKAAVAAAIGAAARDIGFFSVANHGVPAALVDEMFAAANAFFALPEDEKRALAIENSPHYLGYARLAFEKLDPALLGDWKESFNMGRERAEDDPDLIAGVAFVGRNQWPPMPAFRATMVRYFEAVAAVAARVKAAIALDLALPEEYFEQFYDRPISALRVLHYPPHPGAFDGTRYGAGAHTDYGGITLLAQDDAGGLEVRRRDGTWIPVAPVAGAFVCNIGDALMRWTNDIYVSNAHRVVNTSGRDRYSCAFFDEPNPDAQIVCIPSCASAEHPAKYGPVAYADYLRSRLEPTYA